MTKVKGTPAERAEENQQQIAEQPQQAASVPTVAEIFGVKSGMEIPDFMRDEQQTGLEDAKQYVVPPRIKIVQKQAGAELLERYNVGDVIAVPQQQLVAPVKLNDNNRPTDTGEDFYFVPIFFYTEWCKLNPFELRGQVQFIEERTTDVRNPLVAKCRNEKLRQELHPASRPDKALYYNNVEFLNYIIVLVGQHEMAGIPMVLSFSKAEHFAGRQFTSLVDMRRAAMWGCQFAAHSQHRPGTGKGDWYGIDIANPAPNNAAGIGPYVASAEMYAAIKGMRTGIAEAYAEGILRAEYEDETQGATTEPADSGRF